MNNKEKFSFTETKQSIQTFKDGVADFSQEKNDLLNKQLESIKDDIELIMLESEERQEERIKRREELNQKIRKYNKQGPQNAIDEYIGQNPQVFRKKLENRGIHIDEKWNIHTEEIKKKNQGYNIVPVDFIPKQLFVWDHYDYVKTQLGVKGKEVIEELTQLLEIAQTKAKNIFEYYTMPSELFQKLGISVQKVNYSFFAQEQKKDKIPRKSGIHNGDKDKVDVTPPTFKKIWLLMKYLLENNISFRANNIIEDNNQRYQFYFYDKDITILISDEISGNCFRDSTYAIKWIVPGLRNVNKEELKNHQGKKIIYNENRNRRIESVFTDDPQNRPIIGEEKEDIGSIPKKLITDRAIFTNIIREHFTPETFNGASYRKFAQEYNASQDNAFLVNDTIYWGVSLLGLWGKNTVDAIRKAIFEFKKPKLEIPKDSYFFNEYTRHHLLDIQRCEWFDPEKTLGSVNYRAWILELVRKACKEEYADAVKNKKEKEKKTKLEEYTGIKNIPLDGRKVTTMLGWCVRCLKNEYQKILRKRFVMYVNKQTDLQEYKDLQKEILEYETKWEDDELHPNTNKSDRRIKQTEEENNKQEPTNQKIDKKEEKQKIVVSKNVKKIQDDTQNDLLSVLKDPITMETFPLHVVKSVKLVSEYPLYRIVKAYNCHIELRLSKSSVGNNAIFNAGDKIEVFWIRKNDNFITVWPEREKGIHKVVKFRDTHPDRLVDTFVLGEFYDGVVNNVNWRFAYISLTKNHSGRLLIQSGEQYKIGNIVKVTFDGIGTNKQNDPYIKIH